MAKRKSAKKKRPGKKVRVDFRRNRARPARDKSWTRQFREHGFADRDTLQIESVAAKGDLSRKRTVIIDDRSADSGQQADAGRRRGVVVSMRGPIAEVDHANRIWPCTVRRVLRTRLIRERHPVTVGDRVWFRAVAEEDGLERQGVIEQVEPRTGCLTRTSDQRVHVIAANVDQAVIVASADEPPIKPHLIDRYIIAAHAGNVVPVICVNKIDLDREGAARAALALYTSLGYRCLGTSTVTGDGIDQLKNILTDRCSVFVGQSGVGKSSLLNTIEPSLVLPTADVSEATLKGRHATTGARLIKLPLPAYVVDTAGIRSFDLGNVARNEIEAHFVEFIDRVADCKYPDCTHVHEGGCAIRAAVEAGQIHPQRYESYVRIFTEP